MVIPVRVSCRAGHEWETVETATTISTVCPVCGEIVALAGESLGLGSDPESFAVPGDELPPLPPSTSETTVNFARAETLEMGVEGATLPGFHLVRELGRGGMGVVYLARQVSLNRLVAVKLVRAGVDAHAPEVDRFRAEAQAVAALQHPHVVQVFEVGTHNGRPYFTQEYLGGGDLAARINGTPWPPRQAAELVASLARAVQYAHDQGIIHRDLKPANILFATDDLAAAKITDFGIAKRLDARSDHTQTGMIIGTPSYMAPEQAAGMSKQVGPRADVYALGAILYELLTGRPPFKASTAVETLHQVVHDDPIPPSRLVTRLPRDVEIICLKCLEKSPTRRYATSAELAEDLGRFRDGEPIMARPVTKLEWVWKWTRRRPAVAALVGVSLLGLVLATVFGLLYQRDLTYERNRFLQERNESRRATADEQQARAASDRHFAQAVDAVDRMLKRLGMDPGLESTPQMDETRRQLLQDALAFYEQFLQEETDDPVLRGKAAEVAERTGSILQLMGRFEEAEALYTKAYQWQEGLVAMHADEPAYRYLLSYTQETLGELYERTGRVDAARQSYQRSLENREQLLAVAPRDPQYRYQVARSLACLARVEPDATQQQKLLKSSIESAEVLLAAQPSEMRFSFLLGDSRNTLGVSYLNAGRTEEALTLFAANTTLYEVLVSANPESNLAQHDLAMSLANQGQALSANEDLVRSYELHLKARDIRHRLEAEHPQMVEYSIDIGHSYLKLGRLDYYRGEQDACREWCTKGIDKFNEILLRVPNETRVQAALYDTHFYRLANAERVKDYSQVLIDVMALIALDERSHIGPPGRLESLRAAQFLQLARLGPYRAARQAYASIPESAHSVWNANDCYTLALAWSCYGLAVEKDTSIGPSEKESLIKECTGLALQSLESLRKKVGFSAEELQQKVASEPEFQWLHGRAEYQEFVDRLMAETPVGERSEL